VDFTPDPFLTLLLCVGGAGLLAIFLAWRRQTRRLRDAARGGASHSPAKRPFATPSQPVWRDAGRVAILVAAFVAAAAVVLVALPQGAVEALAGRLEARRRTSEPEKVALLYLGDAFDEAGGTYRIRGVVRNVSPRPLGQMDAIVRLYNRNRVLLEAVIVRLDKDALAPGDFARLNLTIPKETEGFAGYAVEFKLRGGEALPYKDLRGARRGAAAQKPAP
jgi:hypothetical protein